MSELKVKGNVMAILPLESGISKAGKNWEKQCLVIDRKTQYNPLVCIEFFGGEKVKLLEALIQEQEVEVFINISSREHNEKYYHAIQGWKINANSVVQNSSIEDGDDPTF